MSTFTHKYRPPFIENCRDDYRIRHYGAPWPAKVPEGTENRRHVPFLFTKCENHGISITRHTGATAQISIESRLWDFSFYIHFDAAALRDLAARALDAAHDIESNPRINLKGDVV